MVVGISRLEDTNTTHLYEYLYEYTYSVSKLVRRTYMGQ